MINKYGMETKSQILIHILQQYLGISEIKKYVNVIKRVWYIYIFIIIIYKC